jgi:L-lactate dehydrogenase complex protein LldG
MTARDEVLANIRRSLGVRGTETTRRTNVEGRLQLKPVGVIPARGQLEGTARIDLFKRQAEAAQASVATVNAAAGIPAEIARYLRDHNLPASLRLGTDPRLAALPFQDTALEISVGRSLGHDLNALSHAFAGVAETGSLILTSGADNPTSLNFLPDNHIVVIQGADIVGDYETVWQRIRAHFGAGVLPRTINMITGPSRSADIEQTIFLGAHGPRRLHIIVVVE